MHRPTFLACCADCGSSFSRPELSDSSYGTVLFSTSDGQHHAHTSAFDEFQLRVERLATDEDFWDTLARLADPVNGQTLVADRPCPQCGSTNLKSRVGAESGTASVEEVTFYQASLLNDDELATRINNKLRW